MSFRVTLRRLTAGVLCVALILVSPGLDGYLVFAQILNGNAAGESGSFGRVAPPSYSLKAQPVGGGVEIPSIVLIPEHFLPNSGGVVFPAARDLSKPPFSAGQFGTSLRSLALQGGGQDEGSLPVDAFTLIPTFSKRGKGVWRASNKVISSGVSRRLTAISSIVNTVIERLAPSKGRIEETHGIGVGLEKLSMTSEQEELPLDVPRPRPSRINRALKNATQSAKAHCRIALAATALMIAFPAFGQAGRPATLHSRAVAHAAQSIHTGRMEPRAETLREPERSVSPPIHRTPRYFQILLLTFVPSLFLLSRTILKRIRKIPYLVSIGIVSAISWAWSMLMTQNHWWGATERFMLGINVTAHLPLEEFLFYPLATALVIGVYECMAVKLRHKPRPVLYWSYLTTIAVFFGALGFAARAMHPYYLYSQLAVYGGLSFLLAPLIARKIHSASMAFNILTMGLLIGCTWDCLAFTHNWWNYFAVTGIRISAIPIDDFIIMLLGPTAAVSVYLTVCRVLGVPKQR